MKGIILYTLKLTVIIILLTSAGYLVNTFAGTDLRLNDIALLSALFTFISALIFGIFLRGQSKEPDSGTMHTLVSVSLKFLLDMIIALVWLIILKKKNAEAVVIFFVIYLTFTLFTILSILKILRIRSIQKL